MAVGGGGGAAAAGASAAVGLGAEGDVVGHSVCVGGDPYPLAARPLWMGGGLEGNSKRTINPKLKTKNYCFGQPGAVT